MNRSYADKAVARQYDLTELKLRTAVHEAGHAAAIYLGNRQKHLPPVFFQIAISGLSSRPKSLKNCLAKVEGGRLIHTLNSSVNEAARDFSAAQKQAYLKAFDADIVNFLVGPLAEANYLATMNDDIFNPSLLNLSALPCYGGDADLKAVQEYLDCFSHDALMQRDKINASFAAAFAFINDRHHWQAIIALTQAILASKKDLIGYQEIVAVLDAQHPGQADKGKHKRIGNRHSQAHEPVLAK
jgi:hypothetical protein